MAKRKKGKVPPHLRRYLFKKKRRARQQPRRRKNRRKQRTSPVAKRRKTVRKTRRRTSRRAPSRRRRSGGTHGYGMMPPMDDLKLMGAAALVGVLETKAKEDENFILNKVPKPINQLGYTGNLALMLRVLAHFTHNKWALLGSRAAATVASYHLGRLGKPFTAGNQFFTISGWTDDDVAEAIQQRLDMGALNPDGGPMPGVMQFEDSDMAY